jgi:hypothetical protein
MPAGHGVAQAVAHGGELSEAALELAGLGGQPLTQGGVTGPGGQQVTDLGQGEACRPGGGDHRERVQRGGGVGTAQPSAGGGGDQPLALVKPQRRRCQARAAGQVTPPANVIYTGPQLEPATPPARWRQPWNDTGTPLVLVSLSTTDQGQQDLLDRLLAAIGCLPVTVPADASVAALRAAIATVLGDLSFRQSAEQMARA